MHLMLFHAYKFAQSNLLNCMQPIYVYRRLWRHLVYLFSSRLVYFLISHEIQLRKSMFVVDPTVVCAVPYWASSSYQIYLFKSANLILPSKLVRRMFVLSSLVSSQCGRVNGPLSIHLSNSYSALSVDLLQFVISSERWRENCIKHKENEVKKKIWHKEMRNMKSEYISSFCRSVARSFHFILMIPILASFHLIIFVSSWLFYIISFSSYVNTI